MRRYPLVIAGTIAGAAAVLAFPVHRPSLVIPPSAAGTASPTSNPVAGPGTTAPEVGRGSTATAVSPTTSAGTTAGTAPATRVATGTDEQFRYGDIAVKVTVQGSKITDVGIASLDEPDGRSAQIDSYAVPQLEQQVIAAESANIDGVSGATFTSQAFVDSLSSALNKLGLS
jgi:uncharacterized protein with FMN-binding domain